MQLSLITIYRDRPHHLKTLLNWWGQYRAFSADIESADIESADIESADIESADIELILIELTPYPTPGLADQIQRHGGRYGHLPNGGTLHKTRGLNMALTLAQGQWVAPLDVDLQPWQTTLRDHLTLALTAPQLLVTGYRLMLPVATAQDDALPSLVAQAAIAPEDQPTALHKHLLQGEKFGVMPFFNRQRLLDIGGWDEAFVGWGAEDQDVIERYLADGRHLCRCPHLVYLHWHHPKHAQWQRDEIVAANRRHYYAKRQHSA